MQGIRFRQLGQGDAADLRALSDLFGRIFEESERYSAAQPSDTYLTQLLGGGGFFAMIAQANCGIIGGLAGYELKKFERPESELYIYDLAVDPGFRRRGIASHLIRMTQALAHTQNAHVVCVQADYSDPPAVALYSKLGLREEVLHFDLPPRPLDHRSTAQDPSHAGLAQTDAP